MISGGAHAVQREAALVPGVDELLVRGRRLGEDPEPAVGILAREDVEHAVGDALAADAVEAVAPCDDVAGELDLGACVDVPQTRPVRGHVVQRHLPDFEVQRSLRLEPGGDQVPHDLLLAVDGDVPAGERGQVDPVARAAELELQSVVRQALLRGAGPRRPSS